MAPQRSTGYSEEYEGAAVYDQPKSTLGKRHVRFRDDGGVGSSRDGRLSQYPMEDYDEEDEEEEEDGYDAEEEEDEDPMVDYDDEDDEDEDDEDDVVPELRTSRRIEVPPQDVRVPKLSMQIFNRR